MVILFIVVGALFGAAAAGLVLWLGGSILLAVLCYSVFGTLGALGVVFAIYYASESMDENEQWQEAPKSNDPISA